MWGQWQREKGNEIFNYLSSIEIYKDDIRKYEDKYPNININQIYNSFPLIYPDRLKGNTINISKKEKLLEIDVQTLH